MTKAAQDFITPLTLQTLSGQPVYTGLPTEIDLLDPHHETTMDHIQLARWADVVLIAPASAECLANLACGHAHDLLATVCLATNAKIALAPAMNQKMWNNKSTQANCQRLEARGYIFLGPSSGVQACGDIGPGRMLDPLIIVDHMTKLFDLGFLTGVKIMITAGPTQEAIDPVRYITNYSSGKMGYAIAQAAVEAGAEVTLISGPTHLPIPERVKFISVVNAQQMYERVFAAVVGHDIVIANAAVSDYRTKKVMPLKMSKQQEEISIEFIRNPDIIADVAALSHRPYIVGFAAETNDIVTRAQQKLKVKGIHMIAANQVGLEDRGFGSENNALTLIWEGGQQQLALASKSQIARSFIKIVAERYALYEKNSVKNS